MKTKIISEHKSMTEEIKWIIGLGAAALSWFWGFIWLTHKSVEELRRDCPKWSEMKDEIQKCSDQKDKHIDALKEDTQYIRKQMDKMIDRELNKK